MKGIRLAVVVNDLHCGSTVGLLPPGFERESGQAIGQNPVQRWLWECWTDAVTCWIPSIVGGDPYDLIIAGDCIDGNHHGTKEIISPDEGDHVEAAKMTLDPVRKKAEAAFMLDGTEVHTKQTDGALGRALDCYRNPDTKRYSFERLEATYNGCLCVFRHHIDVTSRTYLEATQLSIHLGLEQLEAAKGGYPVPKVLCCAHRHRFGYFRDATGLCVVGAPWQVLTRHGHKVVSAARTRPGIYVLDWRGKSDGELPEVRAITYRAPEGKGVRR